MGPFAMLKRLIALVIVVGIPALAVWWFFFRETPPESPEVPPASPALVKTLREAKIHDEWEVKQLSIDLDMDLTLALQLKNGDKVEGYYYLENGDSIGFKVSGNSLVYQSQPAGPDDLKITSDKFTFTASQAQG